MPSAPSTELDRHVSAGRGDHTPRRSFLKTAPAKRSDPDLVLAEALNRSIAGDSEAFAQLYRSTSPRVYGVVSRVLKCPDQAAEVTQEIYLEVWRQAVRYDSTKGGVMTWMTTIAHRRAVDRVRHVSSTRARDQHYAADNVETLCDDVWDSVASRVDAAHVRTALARLAPIYQQTLGLAYFGGRTQSQIAAALNLPLGTVKTRVRNGLIALRGELLTD
jgi:RNA polymerase sigma-70 factor (ECF subfamily)